MDKCEMNTVPEASVGDITEMIGAPVKREPFWIFGYGSLCWNPGFEYEKAVTGYIKGFSRRFWQGNTTHRGTDNKPGRVATLIEEKEGVTWGKAFLVSADDEAALPYLDTRECRLGGYRIHRVAFHPRPSFFSSSPVDTKEAVMYIAAPENRHWLGAAPLPDIARQILECNGNSGTNVEYLLKLAEFMRDEIPEALDEHLFSLERLVRVFAVEMKICLRTLMGDTGLEICQTRALPGSQFASRVQEKKLRCVNM